MVERVLVVRADRIGDVVLSTPVFTALKRARPSVRLTVMVREALIPVLSGHPDIDELMIYEPEGRHSGTGGLGRLASEIRAGRFDAAVALQSQARIAAALFAARVPVRIGPASKPHSYLFYNRRIRQRRSRVEKHEADYNLDLLRPLGIEVRSREIATTVALSAEARDTAAGWLRGTFGPGIGPFVAIHPGMGGSALNWPEENYLRLGEALLSRGVPLVVTAGPGEEKLLERFERALSPKGKAGFFRGGRDGGIDVLTAVFERAAAVVAPSTGPLHLAVAAGAPVVSFYPPIRVQSAERWGPYTARGGQARVLVPDEPCMERLTVDDALGEVLKILESPGREAASPPPKRTESGDGAEIH